MYFNLDQYRSFLNYTLNNKKFLLNHPLNQPIETGEIAASLRRSQEIQLTSYEKKWFRIISKDLYRLGLTDSITKSGRWNLGVNAVQRLSSQNSKQYGEYRVELYGIYQLPYLVFVNRTVTDQSYKKDPNYFGDTGEWIYGRVEDAYGKLQYKALALFGGRISRNFGMFEEVSLIFSDNPYSFDHFGFILNTSHVYFCYYCGRLNNLISIDSQADNAELVNATRYFSIQRGTIRISDKYHIGLTQTALYGGEDKQLEFYYLNPLNLYYIEQRNNRSQMNGFWAVEFFWNPSSKFSWYTQWLIDDVIVNNEPGQNDRSEYPDRMGITSKMIFTDCLGSGSMLDLTYTQIGNWTYMSFRTWENYTYSGQCLGYPENSVETFGIQYKNFSRPPFLPEIYLRYRRHGTQDINEVYGSMREKFPRGIVENSFCTGLKLLYMPSNKFFVKIQTEYNSIKNLSNIEGRKKENYSVTLSLFVNMDSRFAF